MSRWKMDECYKQGVFYLVPKVYNFVHEALEFETLSFEATVKRLQLIDHLDSLDYYADMKDEMTGSNKKKSISCSQQTDDVYFEFHPFLTRQFILLPKTKKTQMARRMSYSSDLIDTLSKVDDLSNTCRLHEKVTKSDIVCSDHVGWLTDLSTGRPMWCVVTDMLLCVFDNESIEESSKVLVLPAYTVRSLVFNSAARNNYNSSDVIQRSNDSSKTVSGMERFQIVIENDITGERTELGTNTKANLDRWVAVLKVATSLDLDILNTDSDEDTMTSSYEPSTETTGEDILSRYTPSFSQDVKRTDITLSWLNGHVKDGAPEEVGCSSPASVHKIGNLSSLGGTVPSAKWCSTRKSLSPIKPEGEQVVRRSGKSAGALEKTSTSKDRSPIRPMSAMYSYDLPKTDVNGQSLPKTNQLGIGSKIVRRASLLREKMFKAKSPKSQSDQEYSRLANLQDVKISGYLYQKTLLSWSKHWCAVSKGNLYSFKNKTSTESAESVVSLHKYVFALAKNDKHKRSNAFKLSCLSGKTLNMAALDTFDLNRWVQVLRSETMESANDSLLSTPELSRIGATDRRSSSTSNSVHEIVPGDGGDSDQSHDEPTLDYPESSDEDGGESSSASSSQGGDNYNPDTAPKHDIALRQLWKNKKEGKHKRVLSGSLGFDVTTVKDDNVLFVPDDCPASRNELDSHEADTDDVFNEATVPDILVTEDEFSVSCPAETLNKDLQKTRKISNSRSCGDLPALCKSTGSKGDLTVHRMNELNLECGRGAVDNIHTENRKTTDEMERLIHQDVIQMKRQKLLQDMMKQRDELERRHVNKDAKTSARVPKTAEIANQYHRAQIEQQQKLVRDATQLRQRRMSTQLKVDTLEKKLHQDTSNNNNRKSVFGFGGKQKSTLKNTDNKHLQDQLSELKERLTDIDKGLDNHEKHREQTMKQLQTSESQAIQRLEQHAQLKASLGAIMEVVESPKPPRKTHIDNYSIASSTPDASPDSNRKISNKIESTSSDPYRRSSNESAGSLSIKSSIGSDNSDHKINPETLAQIEEFELLTKQVLQQQGAW